MLPKPRFQLRTLFLATTALAVALTIYLNRGQRSAAIEAWDLGLRNLICENLGRSPAGTRAIDPPNTPTDPAEPPQVDATKLPRLSADELASLTFWNPSVSLDVTAALSTETPPQLAERLLRHYESGLEHHAMVRKSIQLCSAGPQSTEPSAVWLSADPDLGAMVTIDVRVDETTRSATIQLRHVARPDVGLW